MRASGTIRLNLQHVALLWSLALAAWALTHGFLAYGFAVPWVGMGVLLLLGLMGASAWAALEEPSLDPEARSGTWRWALGLALVGAGQAILFPDLAGKDAAAAIGFALLGLGVAFVYPQGRARKAAFIAGALLLVLGFFIWAQRERRGWDLFQGPWQGQHALIAFWVCLGSGVLALSWQAAGLSFKVVAAPLSRRREMWALMAIVLVGAFLRFWRPAQLPWGLWYDEVNLARVIQDRVLGAGQVPLYVTDQVENPGAWLWVGAAFMRLGGASVDALRIASGLFGLLAVLPFWGLARFWLGARWALVAALLFATMRWTLIPQRIAFMSGFALFWMLAAFWALWWAWLRGGAWRWAIAGLALGANLHTYTPARFVPVIAGAFLLGQLLPGLRKQGPRLELRSLLALGAGFLLSAGPMLWYIATHWADYTLRAKQVSLFTDVAKTGRPLLAELWGTATKHLLMFNYRGDFNARHNLHFLPHVDLLTAGALAFSVPLVLGQAFKDARARFLLLWAGAMLAAGIFTLPVEAPQGHRTVLAAPALILAIALALPVLLAPLRQALGAWPQTYKAVGAALLLGAVGLNAHELLARWPDHAATFRSFSPRATLVLRRIQQSQPGTLVLTSELPAEYQFHGYEWGVFARFALRQQDRPWAPLRPGTAVPPVVDGLPTRSALLIWGESDQAITQMAAQQWPDLPVHKEPQPHPAPGEPSLLYLALEVPYDRVPARPRQGALPLLWRAD